MNQDNDLQNERMQQDESHSDSQRNESAIRKPAFGRYTPSWNTTRDAGATPDLPRTARKSGVRSAGLYALLALALASAFWFFFLRERDARLPGMGDEAALPTADKGPGAANKNDRASAFAEALSQGTKASSEKNDLSGDQPKPDDHAAPRSIDPASADAAAEVLRAEDRTSNAAGTAGAASPLPGVPSEPAAIHSTPSTMAGTVPPAAQTSTAERTPAPPVGNEEPTRKQIDERLQRIESIIQELRVRLETLTSTGARLASDKPEQGTTATGRALAPTPVRRPQRPAVAKASPPPQPPAQPLMLGGQLLAVDIWNGEASVVVGTGLPGDDRTRVLRPGDVYNGLALQAADPATGTATFMVPGGRKFTLSTQQGG